MSSVIVMLEAEITVGLLKGEVGKVVAYDSLEKEVWINIDKYTTVVMSPEHINQSNYI